MGTLHNILNDFENGLCIAKMMLQDYSEEALSATFNGGARIARATSPIPRGLPYALDCGSGSDYLLYGAWLKAKSVEFWIYLGSTTEEIIDPVVGNDIDVSSGTLQYTDWDNAYVDAVDTNTIGASAWHHVVITSSTDVILTNGFNLGKSDIQIAGLRWWADELNSAEVTLLYNGTVSNYRNEYKLLLDLPNLADKSGNVAASTNNSATIVASGRNSGNAMDFVSGSSANIAVPVLGNIKTLALWINPDNITQSILDCDGGSHKITVSGGTITATGFTAYYVDGIVSGTLNAKTWQFLVATDSSAFSASALTLGKEGANYFDGMIDVVEGFSSELEPIQINEFYRQTQRGLL